MEDVDELTQEEERLLEPFVTNTKSSVFVLRNLPEVIKGALFSKYSRSPIGLRKLLLKEFILNPESGFKEAVNFGVNSGLTESLAIKKAQDFYDRILDGYGDDSIGELGGAHLAVENVSNLATKTIQDARIGGSPLEKSSRYVWFNKKVRGQYQFFKDPIIMASPYAQKYLDTNNFLFDMYTQLVDPMTKFVEEGMPRDDNVTEAAYKASVRAKVCDSLRGLLPAATLTNMGVFGNGRFFESLIAKMRCHDLREMHDVGQSIQGELDKVIPSFVRRSQADHRHFIPYQKYTIETTRGVRAATRAVIGNAPIETADEVELVEYDADAEIKVVASLMYQHTHHSHHQLLKVARNMTYDERLGIIREALVRRENRRHKPVRAFENATYKFDILGDFGIYRDLQRHRMLTQERQDLTVIHGYDMPKDIVDAGLERQYREAMEVAKDTYNTIVLNYPKEAQYVVPFAYRVRWYNTINLRALGWMAELRSIRQGHPNYRRVAQKMYTKVRAVHPALAESLRFVDMNDYTFARLEAEMKKENKQKKLVSP